jgi:phosphotransferase system HPr (HPr) family protein
MRPASAFAQAAQQFACSVTVRNGDRGVDGKSWVNLILLAARPGTELVLEVSGPDADDALELLAEVLASDGADDHPPATLTG